MVHLLASVNDHLIDNNIILHQILDDYDRKNIHLCVDHNIYNSNWGKFPGNEKFSGKEKKRNI